MALACELYEVLGMMGVWEKINEIGGREYPDWYHIPDSLKHDRSIKTKDGAKWQDVILPQYNLIIEYDGFWFHKLLLEQDRRKTLLYEEAGYRVMRVRKEGLPLLSLLDVRVSKRPKDADMKQMVNAVLIKIQEMSGVELEGIDSYMNESRLRTEDQWKWELERQPNKIPGRIAQPTG